VAACRVVVGLELGKLSLEIMSIPEQHLVEEFSPHGPHQALHERVGQRRVCHSFDFVNLLNPQVRLPSVRVEQRIVIRAEISRYTLPWIAALNMRQTSAPVTGPQCTPNPTRRRVNWSMTTSTQ